MKKHINIYQQLSKLSKHQLKEICKLLAVTCPVKKKDIIYELLQPLEYKYTMEKREERAQQRKKEREEKVQQRKKEREEKHKKRSQKSEENKKSRELERKSRELERKSRELLRKQKSEERNFERQQQINEWKEEGKTNVEIAGLLMNMNISS
jgi:hypothetical protein